MTARPGSRAAPVALARTFDDLVGDVDAAVALRSGLAAIRRDAGARLEQVQDWYIGLVGTLVLGSIGVAGVRRITRSTGCGTACPDPRHGQLLAVMLAALAIGTLVLAARTAGPLGADPARLTWLHATPADRGRLLRPVWAGRQVGFAAAGAASGVLLGTAVPGQVAPGVGSVVVATWAAVLLAAAGWAAACLGTMAQAVHGWRTGGHVVLTATVVVAAACAVAVWLDRVPPVVPVGGTALAASGVAAWMVAAAVTVPASRVLRRVPAVELRRGGAATGAATASLLMLDTTAVTAWGQTRRVAARGRFASRPSWGTGPVALASADVRRLVVRRPVVLVAAATTVLVCGALTSAAGPAPGLVLAVAAVVGLARASGGAVAAWTRSSGLRRALGGPPVVVRSALLVAPGLVLAGWGAAAVPLLGLPGWFPVCVVCGGLSSLLRSTEPPTPADYSLLVSTPMGAVPTGLLVQLATGIVEAAIPIALAGLASWPLALGASAAVLAWGFGRASWR